MGRGINLCRIVSGNAITMAFCTHNWASFNIKRECALKSNEEMQAYMDSLGYGEDNLSHLLYNADLSGEFEDDESWARLCEFAVQHDNEKLCSIGHRMLFANITKGKMEKSDLLDQIKQFLGNEDILAAFAIHRSVIDRKLPLIPMAASARQNYLGREGEFAVVRFLYWAGFDPNARNPNTKMTALHYFSSLTYLPGANPRAVKWLLAHGAPVDWVNSRGDTALAYMAGTSGWNAALDETFSALIDGGADPFHKSKDGETPHSLMKKNNETMPSPERAQRIKQMERTSRILGGKGSVSAT